MGKLAIVLVAALGLTALIATGRSLGSDRTSEAKAQSVQEAQRRARQVALSGYAEAMQTLADTAVIGRSSLAPLQGRHDGGRYRTSFTVNSTAPYEVQVRVRSTVDRSAGGTQSHVAEGTFRAQPAVPGVTSSVSQTLSNVPPYMRYAAFSDRDMRMVALPMFRSYNAQANTNVHANRDLNLFVSLPLFKVAEGFGTYANNMYRPLLIFDPKPNFRPNLNPSGTPSVTKTPRVDFPVYTALSLLQAAAGDQTVASVTDLLQMIDDTTPFVTELRIGRLELLGNVRLGTREHPKIIYVDGDLVVFNSTHSGYGIYIVTGNVLFENTLTGVMSWFFGQPESHVAYYANGSVLFNGLGDVHGQIVANGNVTFNLAPVFYGNVVARGDVNFLVAPTIRYTAPSPALTTFLPGNPGSDVMREVSFREWES